MGIGGQASGDFRLSSSALRILYSVIKDSAATLSADGFTQSNPSVVTVATGTSSTIPASVKKGVLGGSIAFLRPDIGANTVGGAALVSSAYVANTRPVGVFINDAVGNAYENTPGVASGKGPYLRGGTIGTKLYETKVQTTTGSGTVGTALTTYAVGQFVYASVNGLFTNRWQDSYEAQWINTAALGSGATGACVEPDVTRMGVVQAPVDSSTSELFLALTGL